VFIHFPPIEPNPNDNTLLVADGKTFAKLKVVSKAERRTVFLTEHTLVFVTKGAKLLHFGEKTIKAESGKIILLKKGIYVMAEYIEDSLNFEALLIFLTNKTIQDTLASNSSTNVMPNETVSFLIFNSNQHLEDYITLFSKYFNTYRLRNFQLLQLKQKELLLLLICTNTSNKLHAFLNTLSKNHPENIEYIVNEYLLQPLTINDYANLSNRSLTSFKRDFKKIFNTTPRQWINRKRLEQAYLLLNNTSYRINEISDSCGFENPSYFIKLFKEHYGYTPQALRTKFATF